MFEKPKPSRYLRQHLDGTGSGFELDDLISRHQGDPGYQDVIDEVSRMMSASNDQALTRDDDRAALLRLATELEKQGR